MTATIPPRPAPSRRGTGAPSRKARRRASGGNRIDARAVDENMPEKTPNASRARKAGAAKARKAAAAPPRGRTAKADGAGPGTRRTKDAGGPRGTRVAEETRTRRARALPGTAGAGRPRAVAGARPSGAAASASAPRARTPFVLLIVGLLAGALVSLLLLNTVLAQDAFTLSELQRGNHQLAERRQALGEDIDRESSPEGLHARARSLGMRDVPRPAFIDARTGRVIEGGARPPGIRDDAVAATAATAVAGVPGAIVPPPRTGRTDGGAR